MSVIGSFIAGIHKSHFRFEDSRKLWNLLVTITLNKIRKRVAKNREGDLPPDYIEMLSREPGPEDLAVVQDLNDKIVEGLKESHSKILPLLLQGHSA
jgi:hypothetical protein